MTPHTLGLFVLTALSATLMVTSQKLLTGYSPYRTYVIANGVMFLLSIGARYMLGDTTKSLERNPRMIVLGVAVLLLNVCYVRLYQQNINLAYVPLIVTALMTIFALVVGYFFFQESFSRQAVAGILVVGCGLRLITSS